MTDARAEQAEQAWLEFSSRTPGFRRLGDKEGKPEVDYLTDSEYEDYRNVFLNGYYTALIQTHGEG